MQYPNTKSLLTLTDQFPIRKSVSYANNDDLEFITQVLLALKKAAPEIKTLLNATSQSEAQEPAAPSNVAPPAPQTDNSIRTPADAPSTGDTAAASGHKAGRSRKSASVAARIAADRAIARARQRQSEPASEPGPATAEPAAPPATPAATPETGTASTPTA